MTLANVVIVALTLTQGLPSVAESHDEIVVNCGLAQRKIEARARVCGILGWSFDMSRSGRLVTIEPVRPAAKATHAKLVLRESVNASARELASDEDGFASPIFSPDEKQLLVVRGIHDVMVVDISTGSMRRVGTGIAGLWDSKQNIFTYDRTDSGCHRLKAIPNGADSEFCGGETALSVINGAPTRVNLPVVDDAGRIVGWLGQDQVQLAGTTGQTLDRDQLGYACTSGLDFRTASGGWLTLKTQGGSVVFVGGRSCANGSAVKSAIKALACNSEP